MIQSNERVRVIRSFASFLAITFIAFCPVVAGAGEQPQFFYPAGRSSFVSGEEISVWLNLPPHPGGTGRLILSTPSGAVAQTDETLKASADASALAYSIDSALLAPGRYGLTFRLGGSKCESAFDVVGSVPATHFPLVVRGAPQDAAEARRYRDMQFNMSLLSDVDQLNSGPLALAGMRWMRELAVAEGWSPADPNVRAVGARYVQLAAQATKGAWGFSGVAVGKPPALPVSPQAIDLIDVFADEAEKQLAAMSLLSAAAGDGRQSAQMVRKLRSSSARKLLTARLKEFLRGERFDKTLQAEVRRIADRIAKDPKTNVPAEVRQLLDAKKMPIYTHRLANPFADDATIDAYERTQGMRAPPWWEGSDNWDDWRRFLAFRAGLWPSALRDWMKSARAIDEAMLVGTVSECRPDDLVARGGNIEIRRSAPSPLGALQPLFGAALAQGGGADAGFWMMNDETGPRNLRAMVYSSLASGASGIVYPAAAADAGANLHLAVEAASLNDLVTRYGDFLMALERKPARVAVLNSLTTWYHDLGADPVAQRGRSSYPAKVTAAWSACTRLGFVPAIIGEEHTARALKHYSAVLAPGLQRLPAGTVKELENFIEAGGSVLMDAGSQVAIKGAKTLPLAFSGASAESPEARQLAESLRKQLDAVVRPDIVASRDGFLITEFEAEPPARFFCVLRTDGGRAPAVTEIALPPGTAVVYDVFAGDRADVTAPEAGEKRPVIRVSVAAGEAKLFAILPVPVDSVKLADPKVKGRELTISARVMDQRGAPVTVPVPVAVVILDEAGAERFRVYRCFERGELRLSLPLGMNEPRGRWFVRVTELFSRRSHGTAFIMPDRDPVDVIAALDPAEVFDRGRCSDLLKRARSLTLVAGEGEGRKAAEELARGLQRFAIRCEIKRDTAVMRRNGPPLAGDAILLGDPSDNVLIKFLCDRALAPASMGEHGEGRAIVFWTLSGFRHGGETITVWARDADGLARGGRALLDILSAREATQARSLKSRGLEATPPASAPMPGALPTVQSFELSDSITGVAAPSSGRFLFAASLRGELCAFAGRGERAWQASFDMPIRRLLLPSRGADPLVCFDDAAVQLAIVSAEKWRFEIPDKARGETISAACLSYDGSFVGLGTSAGRVFGLDKRGELRWTGTLADTPEQAGPVAAIVQHAGQTAAAGARRIVLFDKRGNKLWDRDFEGCTSLVFSADGRALIAGNRRGSVKSMKLANATVAWECNLECAIKAVVQTEDGASVAVGESGTVARISPKGKRSVFELGHNVQLVAASADGRRFAAASLSGVVSIFNGKGVLQRFRVPDARVSSMSIASDAKLLMVGDWSGTVRVFKIK